MNTLITNEYRLFARTPAPSGAYIKDSTREGRVEHSGHIVTPDGIVAVQSWRWGKVAQGTILEVVRGGWLYDLPLPRYARPRRLVTLAKRFAAAIAVDPAYLDGITD